MPSDIRLDEKHAGFESLAPEILLIILVQLPDLVSLGNLLRASPRASRPYNSNNPVKITELIMGAGFTHSHIQQTVRIIALIRSSTLPIPDLETFIQHVTLDAMRNHVELSEMTLPRLRLADNIPAIVARNMGDIARQGIPEDSSPSTRRNRDAIISQRVYEMSIPAVLRSSVATVRQGLPENISPAVLRSILGTARQIVHLQQACTKFYLTKFRALEPKHVVDQKFFLQGFQPWEQKPERREYPKRDIGPPSWSEQQRVSRAFWRIQIIHDLKRAAAKSFFCLCPEDMEKLTGKDPIELFYKKHLNDSSQEGEPHPEFEEIRSVDYYMRNIHGTDIINTPDYTSQQQEFNQSWPDAKIIKASFKVLEGASAAIEFYDGLHVYGPMFYTEHWAGLSALDNISFDSFRRFGFAFWDEERMRAYGLLHPDSSQQACNINEFAWQSILTVDEITEQDRHYMSKYRGRTWEAPYEH